ncbi:hypothetical protein E4U26_001885 [Claviceps purpurea]|nr:hypothetical protein E4U26_001885 [Claviceps purpurea]
MFANSGIYIPSNAHSPRNQEVMFQKLQISTSKLCTTMEHQSSLLNLQGDSVPFQSTFRADQLELGPEEPQDFQIDLTK